MRITNPGPDRTARGFTLIESAVATVIVATGVLGMVAAHERGTARAPGRSGPRSVPGWATRSAS